MLRSLRRGDWLTVDRARFYGLLIPLSGLLLAIAFYGRILSAAVHDPAGRPIASDFDTFWAGARLALTGHAALVYDTGTLRTAEAAAAQLAPGEFFIYLYPPTFLLLSLPLGMLPYLVALPVFLLSSFAAWAGCLTRLLPVRGWAVLAVLAFPAGLLNAVIGQNGYVSATCFAAAMVMIETRPMLAGVSLGMLIFKPHLAIAIPLVLLAARRWRTLAACGGAACCLIVLSWMVLGGAVWRDFVAQSGVAALMLQSMEIWPKLVSVYAGCRVLGAGRTLGYAAQLMSACAALSAVAVMAARRPGARLELAAAIPAAMLCTPYVWDYDLVCLSVPMAWLTGSGVRDGWRDWEKTLLAALYVTAPLARFLGAGAGLPVMPVVLAGLLALIAARGLAPGRAA